MRAVGVREDLRNRFQGRILRISDAIAIRWGEISDAAQRRGHSLPVIDALIATSAHVHELTVVTRNTTHIERAGAAVLNPWQ